MTICDKERVQRKAEGVMVPGITDFLPQISHPKLQNMAPTSNPIFEASDRNGLLKWNSFTVGERIRPVTSCVLLSTTIDRVYCADSKAYRPEAVSVRRRTNHVMALSKRSIKHSREPS